MPTLIKFVLALSLLLPVAALAKGDSMGFTMQGTITNISVSGESIHFTFTGAFDISQYRGFKHSVVEINCRQGISATVFQGEPFFAMSSDWHLSVMRGKGDLLKILNAAAEHNRVVKFELYDVKMAVGDGQNSNAFMLFDAGVTRATDADLR